MQLRTLSIIGLSALLSACGTTPADEALERMHTVYTERIVSEMERHIWPAVTETTGSASIIFSKNLEKELGQPASTRGEIHITGSAFADVTDAKYPLLSGEIGIESEVWYPGQTLGSMTVSKSVKPEAKAVFSLQLMAQLIKDTMLLRVATLQLSAPELQQPFELSVDMRSRWYGITITALQEIVKKNAKETNAPEPPSIRLALQSWTRNSTNPAMVRKYLKQMHIWKSEKFLSNELGIIDIYVRSDKQKILRSVRALTEYVRKTSGQSLEEQLRRNPELQNQMKTLLSSESDFIKQMGSLQGILSIDSETYELRGFSGEILDASGKKTAALSLILQRDGYIFVEIKPENDAPLRLKKDGERLMVTVADKTVLEGIVSEKKVSLEAKDAETGKVVGVLSFYIERAKEESVVISDGVLSVPSKSVSIVLRKASMSLDPGKSLSIEVEAQYTKAKNDDISIKSVLKKNASAPRSIEVPVFSPIETLYQDFLQSILGSESLGAPTLES